MSDWTAGYVADIGYTFGYYTELNPLRAKLALLDAGIKCPTVKTACELGFGQGLSANIHGAAGGAEWHGTDFIPAQASFAQELAEIAGSPVRLQENSFAEFAARTDLPDFDFIGLHGIWSWISDENRKVLVDFIRRKLKVGGVLYVSYNTMPGWAAFAPVRHLLAEHADVMGAKGSGILKQIDNAIEFTDKLMELNPVFARVNPQIATRLKGLKSLSRHYLAHEYFNKNWHPTYFSDMAEELSSTKLSYACSANLLEHADALNLTNEQQKFLREISDPVFREAMRDFIVNQQFRRDYWVKGARPLSRTEREKALLAQRIILTSPSSDIKLTITGVVGEVNLKEEIYKPIIDAMSDHRIWTIAELIRELGPKGVAPAKLPEAVMILAGAGHAAPVQDDASIEAARAVTTRLNNHLLELARDGGDINYLASPVTGGGISVGRFQQLFLRVRSQGIKTATEWAGSVWQDLNAAGQKIVRDGKTLETAEENLAELTQQAKNFEQKVLPILIGLGIA